MLMGVISFGSPVCGTPDAPTVFTKIGYYTDWIEEIMEQNVPYIKRKTTLQHKLQYTLPPTYRITKPTTFKIPPLIGKMQPIPIKDVDSLRILHNPDLFEEFLSTMFGSKENNEYQDLLRESKKLVATKKEKDATKRHTKSKIKVTTASYLDVTPMGDVDPDLEETREGYVTEMIESGEEDAVVKVDKDTELQKDLVDLIDNINLKQIIDNISSSNEDKLMGNNNIMNILKINNVGEKISKEDDSVLTLLYLSDSEKNEDSIKKLGVLSDGDILGDIEHGLSIDTESFKDMSYRNKNISVLYDLLPKEDLYDLLSEAIA